MISLKLEMRNGDKIRFIKLFIVFPCNVGYYYSKYLDEHWKFCSKITFPILIYLIHWLLELWLLNAISLTPLLYAGQNGDLGEKNVSLLIVLILVPGELALNVGLPSGFVFLSLHKALLSCKVIYIQLANVLFHSF